MKKPLHILYLARWYPHKFDNMYGLFVKRHAQAAAFRHQISVFYVHACDKLDSKTLVETQKGFINEYFYYYLKAKTGIKILDSLINNWQLLKGHLVLSKKIARPNLIHVHILTRLGVIAFFIQKINNIPYIITEHWSRYQQGNKGYAGFLRKFFTKLVTNNASCLTTVTLNLKNAMERHQIKNEDSHILYNVVDTKIFFPENRNDKTRLIKKLVHLSCFDDEAKNISGLLDCIKELALKRDDFIVEMIGTGKDYTKMVERAKELDLFNNKVFFKGELEGRELGESIRTADILMLFSNYENMPVVINEAFCCGIPVISTNVGGISEIVNETNGVLVEKGDKIAFVFELNKMMDHLENYNQVEIAKYAINLFSVKAIAEKLDEIYTKAVYL